MSDKPPAAKKAVSEDVAKAEAPLSTTADAQPAESPETTKAATEKPAEPKVPLSAPADPQPVEISATEPAADAAADSVELIVEPEGNIGEGSIDLAVYPEVLVQRRGGRRQAESRRALPADS